MINSTIGKYKISRLIGEGGMASIYEAEHEMLGTKVAIKVLNPILSSNVQIRERFRNEAKLMASLDHPNITKVIDFDEQPQQLSIVMEFLNGEDLNQKIKKNGALSEKEITELFSQTLSAFQYAHEKGIIHRDIKPSNIFILSNGNVKILDFGIAKLFGQGIEMTQTGAQIGTPVYMSPEQVKADKSIDQRSDIYSLGVTMFYAINGKPPYNSNTDSQFDIFTKIVYEPLPAFSVQSKFKGTVLKACQKKREERFQSCREWLTELKSNNINELNNEDKTLMNDTFNKKTNVENIIIEEKKIDKKTPNKIIPLDTSQNEINKSKTKFKIQKYFLIYSFLGLILVIVVILLINNFKSIFGSSDQVGETLSKPTSNDTILPAAEVSKPINKDIIIWESENSGYFFDSRDNNRYKVIKIGNQVWMAQNLRFKSKKGCWPYQFSEDNVSSYGYYYDRTEINHIAPNGWHLPSKFELNKLVSYIKSKYKEPVNAVLLGGSTGFNIELIGYLDDNHIDFNGFSKWTHFWSSNSTPDNRYYLTISNHNTLCDIYLNSDAGFNSSFAVRCINDEIISSSNMK